jgi:hypothetical protein
MGGEVMSQHAKRIVEKRKDMADEAAKIAFAEAIDAASKYPDAGFNAMKRQYQERYGEHYYQTLENEGRGR